MKTFRELEIGDYIWKFSPEGIMKGGKIRDIYYQYLEVDFKEIYVEGFDYPVNVSEKELNNYFLEKETYNRQIKIYGTDLESLKEYGIKMMIEIHEETISGILETLGKRLDRIEAHYEELRRIKSRG